MVPEKANTKISYIDNLRVLLTILVVLHHTFIAYGAPGGWYFTDKTNNPVALIVQTLFVATNQSFFMGFFFFLSALFTEPSFDKKGALYFTADRLKRLGIPLLFYSFVLGPFMNFLIYRFGYHKQATFIQYLSGYDDWIDPGVLWFVTALLLFTLLYVLYRRFRSNRLPAQIAAPGNNTIILFALALGVISYLVRIVFPAGWVLHLVGFQLAHFPQYIAMFIFGIVAYHNNWLNSIDYKKAIRFLMLALVMVFIVFPVMFVVSKSPIESYQGNGSWQSLLAAMWEQLTGISIIVAITGIAKYKWNYTTSFLKQLSRVAYATYIFHPLIVICITLLLKPLNVDPAFKLLIAAPFAVSGSFALAWLVTRLPFVKEIV